MLVYSTASENLDLGTNFFLESGKSFDFFRPLPVTSARQNLKATFHHAFDEAEDAFTAILVLKRLKQVNRILTSGGNGEWSEKIERLSRFEEKVGPEIEVLAGGGIDQQSIRMICQATGYP